MWQWQPGLKQARREAMARAQKERNSQWLRSELAKIRASESKQSYENAKFVECVVLDEKE